MPVIADERVERDFGTGALKITPGHDPTDFAIGRDHGLPEPMCIGPDGLVTAEGLEGLTQKEAEEKILAWVKERGQLEKREHYRHAVARLRALRVAHRAADLAAVVVLDGGDQAAGARGAARAQRRLPPGEPAPLRDRLARERARLEHLAADLVGPSDPRVVLPGRPHHRRRRRSRSACAECGVDRADARDRRARHVVLARRSGRSRRSAGPTRRRTSSTSTPATCRRPRARSSASGRTA